MHYVQLIIVIAAMVAASAATVAVIRLVASHKDVAPRPPVRECRPHLGTIHMPRTEGPWTADYGQLLYGEGFRFIYVDNPDVSDYIITESGQIYPLAGVLVADVVARSFCLSCGKNVVHCRCYDEVWCTSAVSLTTEN